MFIPEYLVFGEIWQQHLHSYAAKLPGNSFPTVAKDDGKEAMLDAVIHLPEWPASSGKSKHRMLHILVHARERFGTSRPHQIVESKIRVTYLRVNSELIATALSTIRYDYDQELRPAHPLYHFHCSSDPISEDHFPSSVRYKTLERQSAESCYPFRVPTPHMGLCSVLIGLVADHLPPKTFKELCEAIAKKGWTPPLAKRCDLWNLGQVGAIPRVIHSWQWYL